MCGSLCFDLRFLWCCFFFSVPFPFFLFFIFLWLIGSLACVELCSSDHREPFASVRNRKHQLLSKHFRGRVLGQVNAIETGMCLR